MKLSVITICYNEKEIRRTCESIVNQSWQDFEWIVVDGGSTDGTLDILNEYKNRIDILISEKDNGIYNAMNKGIKLAKGEWLSFMNGGDTYYENSTLEKIFNNNDYQASVLYGNVMVKDKITTPPKVMNLRYIGKYSIPHQASFIKKELFDKYGLYNEEYRIVSDYEKFCIFYKNEEKFLNIPLCIANFDNNGVSCNPKYFNIVAQRKEEILNNIFSSEEIKKIKSYTKSKLVFNFIKSYFLFPWYTYKIYKLLIQQKTNKD